MAPAKAGPAVIVRHSDKTDPPLMAYETYRSQARQTRLYHQRATKLKTVGVHHYGLACDLVKDIAGEPSWKGDFAFLGRIAKKHKMIWDDDWRSPGARHEFVDSVACGLLICVTAHPADGFDMPVVGSTATAENVDVRKAS